MAEIVTSLDQVKLKRAVVGTFRKSEDSVTSNAALKDLVKPEVVSVPFANQAKSAKKYGFKDVNFYWIQTTDSSVEGVEFYLDSKIVGRFDGWNQTGFLKLLHEHFIDSEEVDYDWCDPDNFFKSSVSSEPKDDLGK